MHAIVVWADGLAAHWLGAYGNEWVTTPHLDRLAARGVVFDWHYTDGPVGPPTARHSFAGDRGPHLCSLLAERGVEVRRSDRKAGDGVNWIETTQLLPPWDTPEEIVAEYFTDDPGSDEPLDPVTEPPAGLLDDRMFDAVQRSFAAAVTAFDADVGELLETLDPDGQALVVVTSGHGQELGDHGQPGPLLREARVHVPLLLCWPGRLPAGGRVAALTQSVDLLPTLLDAFGTPIPADCHGTSLLPLARGEAASVRPYLVLGTEDGAEWALRTPDWFYHWPRAAGADGRLYGKPDDRWEVNDLRQQNLDWCDHLETMLRDYAAAAGKAGPLVVPALSESASG